MYNHSIASKKKLKNIIKLPPLFGTGEDGYMSVSLSSKKLPVNPSSLSYSDDSPSSDESVPTSSPYESLLQCCKKSGR